MPSNSNNTERKSIILVPYDFTAAGDAAITYASVLATKTNYTLALVHITKSKNDIEEVTKKLDERCTSIAKEMGVSVSYFVREGNIFCTINEIAEEIVAGLVVMGTHGITGLQKVLGSNALKVISHSEIPYIVLQEDYVGKSLENIVFPIDFKKEDKEKLNWVYYLAKNYKSKFHVLKAKKTDRVFKKQIDLNLMFTTKFFNRLNISYEIHDAPGKNDFSKETVEFAKSINADMILIMTTKNINLTDYIFGAHEQYIIDNNAKIPVMCVNPKPLSLLGSFSAGG